jgi:hypothetical protein
MHSVIMNVLSGSKRKTATSASLQSKRRRKDEQMYVKTSPDCVSNSNTKRTFVATFVTVILIIISCVHKVDSQFISPLTDETRSRLNYGVNFKHVTSYKPTTDIYRITFAVTIPQLTQTWQHAHTNGSYRQTGKNQNVTKAHFLQKH